MGVHLNAMATEVGGIRSPWIWSHAWAVVHCLT